MHRVLLPSDAIFCFCFFFFFFFFFFFSFFCFFFFCILSNLLPAQLAGRAQFVQLDLQVATPVGKGRSGMPPPNSRPCVPPEIQPRLPATVGSGLPA